MSDHAPSIGPEALERVLGLALDLLRGAPAAAAGWEVPAGPLEWNCWETGEHLADDLFAYAAQLAEPVGPLGGEVPFRWAAERAGGPANTIHADPAAGRDGMLRVLASCGALLASMARTTPSARRAHHTFGATGPEGFAAMGMVEILVHTDDLARGLGLDWTPPEADCAAVLDLLFPDLPDGVRDFAPSVALLWATGRAEFPGHPRRTEWRWQNPGCAPASAAE
jgi:hypothetical protein